MTAPVITLDGPSGAGKGTLARALADQLGWHVLDSGALYRVIGWYATRQNWDPALDSHARLAASAATTLDIQFDSSDGQSIRVLCNGMDISTNIRTAAGSAAASRWAVLPVVRQALVDRQRAFRVTPGLVADGRDMGTVIFPDAPLKIYVTASAAERALRRYRQTQPQGELSGTIDSAMLSEIESEIRARDERDASRAASPLKPADDAVVIDTTGDSVGASLDKVREFVRQKGWL